jgi:ABC-2 type transport system permease protein
VIRRFPVLAQGLRDRRRSLVWWSLGVAIYIAMISAVWPSIQNAPSMTGLMDQLPQALLDFMGASDYSLSTGAGYVSGELFGFMIPIFILILTIGAGAAAVGGAEDRGTLDLLLSHPISRRRVVLESAALVAVEAVAFGIVIVVSLAIANPLADLSIQFIHLVGAVVGIVLLGILFGWMALAIGAATGSRGLGLAIPGTLGALTYLAGNLSGLVHFLHWSKWISPFWYATNGSPLVHGYVWWHALVLAGAAAVLLGIGALEFDRRDLGT